jgi:hypothetical protein
MKLLSNKIVAVVVLHVTAINAWTGSPPIVSNTATDAHDHGPIVSRRASITKMIFTSIPSVLLPVAMITGVQDSSAEETRGPTTSTQNSQPPMSSSPASSGKSSSDALSSFGKDLNSMSFDSWGGPASDAGAAQRYDNNGAAPPDDLAGAIDQSKRKRAVDPRTHG